MADTPTQTEVPVLPADANPITASAAVPPEEWPQADKDTIDLLQNSPGIMGARIVASKMQALLAAGKPVVLSEDDQRIVDECVAAATPPSPPEDPDMQPEPPP